MTESNLRVGIVLVGTDRLAMEVLSEVIDNVHGLRVQKTGRNGSDAIFLARAFQPRVMVLAIAADDLPGDLILSMIRQASPATRVVVIESLSAPTVHVRGSGAVWATVSSDDQLNQLKSVLSSAAFGRRRPPLVSGDALARTIIVAPASRSVLSSREIQVLELLSEGSTNAEIADQLVISAGTVKRHLANVYTKLGVGTRLAAVRRAVDLGLLHLVAGHPDELNPLSMATA